MTTSIVLTVVSDDHRVQQMAEFMHQHPVMTVRLSAKVFLVRLDDVDTDQVVAGVGAVGQDTLGTSRRCRHRRITTITPG